MSVVCDEVSVPEGAVADRELHVLGECDDERTLRSLNGDVHLPAQRIDIDDDVGHAVGIVRRNESRRAVADIVFSAAGRDGCANGKITGDAEALRSGVGCEVYPDVRYIVLAFYALIRNASYGIDRHRNGRNGDLSVAVGRECRGEVRVEIERGSVELREVVIPRVHIAEAVCRRIVAQRGSRQRDRPHAAAVRHGGGIHSEHLGDPLCGVEQSERVEIERALKHRHLIGRRQLAAVSHPDRRRRHLEPALPHSERIAALPAYRHRIVLGFELGSDRMAAGAGVIRPRDRERYSAAGQLGKRLARILPDKPGQDRVLDVFGKVAALAEDDIAVVFVILREADLHGKRDFVNGIVRRASALRFRGEHIVRRLRSGIEDRHAVSAGMRHTLLVIEILGIHDAERTICLGDLRNAAVHVRQAERDVDPLARIVRPQSAESGFHHPAVGEYELSRTVLQRRKRRDRRPVDGEIDRRAVRAHRSVSVTGQQTFLGKCAAHGVIRMRVYRRVDDVAVPVHLFDLIRYVRARARDRLVEHRCKPRYLAALEGVGRLAVAVGEAERRVRIFYRVDISGGMCRDDLIIVRVSQHAVHAERALICRSVYTDHIRNVISCFLFFTCNIAEFDIRNAINASGSTRLQIKQFKSGMRGYRPCSKPVFVICGKVLGKTLFVGIILHHVVYAVEFGAVAVAYHHPDGVGSIPESSLPGLSIINTRRNNSGGVGFEVIVCVCEYCIFAVRFRHVGSRRRFSVEIHMYAVLPNPVIILTSTAVIYTVFRRQCCRCILTLRHGIGIAFHGELEIFAEYAPGRPGILDRNDKPFSCCGRDFCRFEHVSGHGENAVGIVPSAFIAGGIRHFNDLPVLDIGIIRVAVRTEDCNFITGEVFSSGDRNTYRKRRTHPHVQLIRRYYSVRIGITGSKCVAVQRIVSYIYRMERPVVVNFDVYRHRGLRNIPGVIHRIKRESVISFSCRSWRTVILIVSAESSCLEIIRRIYLPEIRSRKRIIRCNA